MSQSTSLFTRLCRQGFWCYPSLETLGGCLGVSERQARDYGKGLERAGLITVDQR